MAQEPDTDGDGDLDDGDPDVAEEPTPEEPGHALTARDAFPFLPKIVG